MAVCRVGMTLNGEHSLPPGVLGVRLVQTTCGNLNAFFLFVWVFLADVLRVIMRSSMANPNFHGDTSTEDGIQLSTWRWLQ